VLECELEGLNVELDYTDELHMVLPRQELLPTEPLALPAAGELNAVEAR